MDTKKDIEYSIGEFSLITKLSIKTIRFYQDEGLLFPSRTDAFTNYRYYNESSFSIACVIKTLRELSFSIAEIKELLSTITDDKDLEPFLIKKLQVIKESQKKLLLCEQQIETILMQSKEDYMTGNQEIIEKTVKSFYAVLKRQKASYKDVGIIFQELFKSHGRWCNGKPFSMYYDDEYKEENADYEAGFPVRSDAKGENVRLISEYKVISIVHVGSYETLHESYKVLTDEVKKRNITTKVPSREIYLKGPGMIFRGNPSKYRTEIQFEIE